MCMQKWNHKCLKTWACNEEQIVGVHDVFLNSQYWYFLTLSYTTVNTEWEFKSCLHEEEVILFIFISNNLLYDFFNYQMHYNKKNNANIEQRNLPNKNINPNNDYCNKESWLHRSAIGASRNVPSIWSWWWWVTKTTSFLGNPATRDASWHTQISVISA